MITCNHCSRELPDNATFCKYCGTKIEAQKKVYCGKCGAEQKKQGTFCEKCGNRLTEAGTTSSPKAAQAGQTVRPSYNNKPNTVDQKQTAPEKPKKKISPLPFIIGGGAVALIIVVVLILTTVMGRNMNQTVKKFAKAYSAENENKIISLMYPKDAKKDAESYYSSHDIVRQCKSLYGSVDLSSYEVTAETDADSELQADFNTVIRSMGITIETEELKKVTLSQGAESSSGKSFEVMMYRTGNRWYIVPNALEQVIANRQEEDVERGETIASAIQSTLASGQVQEAMSDYQNINISLTDDLEYLPQAFQDEFKTNMGKDSVSDLRHTDDGATGYAFKITDSGTVYVYISSDAHLDEWQISPDTTESYFAGEKREVTEQDKVENNKELRYVRLISEKSPLLGYWQADTAGMYIGYNILGDEGLAVYLFTHEGEYAYRTIISIDEYTLSGNDGMIELQNDYNKYLISVQDTKHVTLHVEGDYIDTNDYAFTQGEIGREILSQYEGTWVSQYGGSRDFVYDETCGAVHETDDMVRDFHDQSFIALYDGVNTLGYIFEMDEKNDELSVGQNHSGSSYQINGDKLRHEWWGGTSQDGNDYFRDGSDEAEVLKAVNAYDEWLKANNYTSGYKYALAYIDGDDIPELIIHEINDNFGDALLTYYNQEVYRVSSGQALMGYTEKGGYFLEHYNGLAAENNYIKLSNGNVEIVASSFEGFSPVVGDFADYTVGGQSVSENDYNNYISGLGEFRTIGDIYSSLYDAYQHIND